jgi:hypothetical protein
VVYLSLAQLKSGSITSAVYTMWDLYEYVHYYTAPTVGPFTSYKIRYIVERSKAVVILMRR